MTDFTNYLRCIAEIEASDRTYRDSPFFRPLSFTMLLPPCGCNIHGDGNIPSPFHIKFCAEHVAVQDTTAEIKRLRERIVELRGSLAQLDGSARAPNITGEPVVREGKGAVWLYSWIASEEDSSAFAYLSWAELAARNPDLRPCGIGVDELGPYVRMRSVGAWPEARIIQEPLGSPSESEKRVRTAKTAIGTRGVLRRTFFSLCQSPPIAGWTDGDRWNGWACPMFEKADADRYVEWHLQTPHGQSASYDAEHDVYLVRNEGESDSDPWPSRVLDNGTKVYPIGAYAYTWEELDAPTFFRTATAVYLFTATGQMWKLARSRRSSSRAGRPSPKAWTMRRSGFGSDPSSTRSSKRSPETGLAFGSWRTAGSNPARFPLEQPRTWRSHR